jgi:hypothetical protein
MNTMNVMSPFCFKDWLDKQRGPLAARGHIDMFGAQFETEVNHGQLNPSVFYNLIHTLIHHFINLTKPA